MTPEQEAAEFSAYMAWKNSEWDGTHSHAGITPSNAWLARAAIAHEAEAKLRAEVESLRVHGELWNHLITLAEKQGFKRDPDWSDYDYLQAIILREAVARTPKEPT